MASNGGRGVFKDKEKPTEVRLSNITAAKGMFTLLMQHNSHLYIYSFSFIFRVLQLLPMRSEQVLALGAWIKWSVIGASLSEPHASVTALSTCVCIYLAMLVWTDHLHKFQMNAFKIFTMMTSTLACTSVSCETYMKST